MTDCPRPSATPFATGKGWCGNLRAAPKMCQYGDFSTVYLAVFCRKYRLFSTASPKSIDRLPKNVQDNQDRVVENHRTFSSVSLLASSAGGGFSIDVGCRREAARRLLASVLHSFDFEEQFHASFTQNPTLTEFVDHESADSDASRHCNDRLWSCYERSCGRFR